MLAELNWGRSDAGRTTGDYLPDLVDKPGDTMDSDNPYPRKPPKDDPFGPFGGQQ